jgi:hypothetical protein
MTNVKKINLNVNFNLNSKVRYRTT